MAKKKRNDGKLLERVVADICSGIEGAKVSHNIKLKGKSGRQRQVDVLIEGKVGPFDVRINAEEKDYKGKVPMAVVDEFIGRVQDTGVDIGVIVSPSGFDDGAKARAKDANIQLIEPISPNLSTPALFIPVRCVIAKPKNYSFSFKHDTLGPCMVPGLEELVVSTRGKLINEWNIGNCPHEKGTHHVELGTVTLFSKNDPKYKQYLEMTAKITVEEEYYLGILPAIGLRNISEGKTGTHYQLDIQADKIEAEWKKFPSLEVLNDAADQVVDQVKDVQNLMMKPHFFFRVEDVNLGKQ
jgi:hypothetical protein